LCDALLGRGRPHRVAAVDGGLYLAALAAAEVAVLSLETTAAGLRACRRLGVPAIPFQPRLDGLPALDFDLAIGIRDSAPSDARAAAQWAATLAGLSPQLLVAVAPWSEARLAELFAASGHVPVPSATVALRRALAAAGVETFEATHLLACEKRDGS
jgi:hypothetical protein